MTGTPTGLRSTSAIDSTRKLGVRHRHLVAGGGSYRRPPDAGLRLQPFLQTVRPVIPLFETLDSPGSDTPPFLLPATPLFHEFEVTWFPGLVHG